MAEATLQFHHKQMYADAVRDLAGSPKRSLLKDLCSKENKRGEAVFIDSVGASEDADVSALSAAKSRANAGVATYDDFLALQTPHKDITRQRTLITPRILEWGHTMDSVDKINEVTDPQSRILQKGMETFWIQQDIMVLNALMATAVMRGKTGVTSTAMPAGQILAALATQSAFVLTVISSIKQKFEAKYYTGPIYCAIPTTVKKVMIDTADNKLTNKDFVDSGRYFTNFELPSIYGVTFIPHPYLDTARNNGTNTLCRYFAWAPEALVWNQFEGMVTELGVAPTQKFNVIAYQKEIANCVRVDDNLVVQGSFTA